MTQDSEKRTRRRFDRQFRQLARFAPWIEKLRSPGWALARAAVGLFFIIAGFLGFLPILGFWMIPLGLVLLAIDIPALQAPVSSAIIRGRRRLSTLRRNRNGR